MDVPFEQAFDDSQPLRLLSRVREASLRAEAPLIHDLAFFVRDLRSERDAYKSELRDIKRKLDAVETAASAAEPAAKKRKLPDHTSADLQTAPVVMNQSALWQQYPVAVELPDVSFSLPMRKKLRLQLIDGPSPTDGGIRIKAPGDAQDDTVVSWTDIEQVICVPVPEKAQPSYQFVVIPKLSAPSTSNIAPPGPLMWTVPSTPPKAFTINKDYALSAAETPLDVLLRHILDAHLLKIEKRTIVPSASEFTSQLVQAHRKGEIAFHVKAFRGSKDGFLYLLPTGILFAPRTPILYFPFHTITSVSYSSVLQRTFNLNISARLTATGIPLLPDHHTNGDAPLETEFEFAMLDQADFAGIDAYVKRHGLHDASLAEHRRAKVYNVNPTSAAGANKAAATNGTDSATGAVANGVGAAAHDGEHEESELAKAERALQDAEDEEEEDYDPSGGESEGSGSESEEEAEGGDGELAADRDVEDDGDDDDL